jgi:DNA recombination protein RmuC
MNILLICLEIISVILLIVLIWQHFHEKVDTAAQQEQQLAFRLLDDRLKNLYEQQQRLAPHLTEHLMKSFDLLRGQITETLKTGTEQVEKQVGLLTSKTDLRLQEISTQVEKRLSDGFEKTTATFQDILKRLVLIDEAQKRITELSSNVVSLQEVLADKRSRGAFGEVQLSALIRNVLPEDSFALQHTLSNNSRADCILFLPSPTGNIVIDSKFPLENYQRMLDDQATEAERQLAARQFKQDVKKHIYDIASKYIIHGETSEGAMMFIPAEAVFAEIHAHHSDLVSEAQKARVWLTSPTTLMAILTTARAVIKDDATRKQIHIIQKHLHALGQDFGRFQDRMTKLAKHIQQAHQDVEDVNVSAKKISSQFQKIEKVELITVSSDVIPAKVGTIQEIP